MLCTVSVIRRCLEREEDWENKLRDYQCYYNESRTHSGRNGGTPIEATGSKVIDIKKYSWKNHCRGLFELPIAA
jgi:putative transposase